MSRAAFDALLASIAVLFEQRAELSAFATFPDQVVWSGLAANLVPAAGQVAAWPSGDDCPEADVHQAVQAVASSAEWRQSYTETEVGKRFLETYGYFELYGPSGHFQCENARGFIAYWGPGLTYDWHDHLAEELYFVLSGAALF
ncbi:MAG: dimethylsulfonioproprionate lyase family protein, partial [Pseudomonadota bacterium]